MTTTRLTRLATLLTLLVTVAFASAAAETAADIMAKCARAFNGAPSLTVKASVASGSETFTATITASHEKFCLEYPQMIAWYDGTTQWTYARQTRELSITEPLPAELLESNPFAILNQYARAYNVRRLSDKQPVVELTPKSRDAGIRKAVLTVDAKTWLPTKIVVTMASGRTMTVTVKSAVKGKKPAASTFIYNKTKYPANEIVDLR